MTKAIAPTAKLASRYLPAWTVDDLPEPKPLGWRNLSGFIGPGIVMCGIQIGGGEWLFGPAVTAKYGGSLMWIATVAIVSQVFYNIECGRYALYCGEPVFTGFFRTRPGPSLWVGVAMLLSVGSLIPGLSTNAAVLVAAMILDRPPTVGDSFLVHTVAYLLLGVVTLPILLGGKVYNMLQWVMTTKVFVVLGYSLFIGIFFVTWQGWWEVFRGFVQFGNVPVADASGNEVVVNAFAQFFADGDWPVVALGSIALLGAFAGYAGGGGLSNSTYSNFVRDKGWGMGSRVGAIASAIGGRNITLSHVGSVFPITDENLRRWRGWWRYILSDQLLVWMPGCFLGMALPALLSIEFSRQSNLYGQNLPYSEPLIAADGLRQSGVFGEWSSLLWLISLGVGLMVFLPSQMSILDDFVRRWTDILWTANKRVRTTMHHDQVRILYYSLLAAYVLWSFISATIFLRFGNAPAVMVTVIANLNNVALGVTSFHLLWVNRNLLPAPLRPRWYSQLGLASCGIVYTGLALLVFFAKVVPMLKGAN